MSLSEAIAAVSRIIKEAMASDSLGRYILANLNELVEAAQIIMLFGFDLFRDDAKVMATPADSIAAGELLGLLAEAEGEDPPLPQLGPLVWISIAYQIAKLILRLREAK